MTRKDYIVIAEAIKDALSYDANEHERSMAQNIANRIAIAMRADNPRFDRERFMTATGAFGS